MSKSKFGAKYNFVLVTNHQKVLLMMFSQHEIPKCTPTRHFITRNSHLRYSRNRIYRQSHNSATS